MCILAGRDIYLNELLEGSGLYVEPVEEAKKVASYICIYIYFNTS